MGAILEGNLRLKPSQARINSTAQVTTTSATIFSTRTIGSTTTLPFQNLLCGRTTLAAHLADQSGFPAYTTGKTRRSFLCPTKDCDSLSHRRPQVTPYLTFVCAAQVLTVRKE